MSNDHEVLETERAALLYDVHGNAEALHRVLLDVVERGAQTVVFGGDYASAGPRPNAAVRRVRRSGTVAIRGNTDEWTTGEMEPPDPEPFEWTKGQLSSEQLEWLDERPFGCRLRPPGEEGEENDLLAVHANPSDLLTPLLIDDHPYDEWEATSEEDVESLVEGVEADLVAFGHIHAPMQDERAGQRLKSLGSIGLPWDGDQRAAYGIAEWDGDQWEVEDHRVEYDWETAVEELGASSAPGSEAAAESLRRASFEPMA